MLNAACTPAVPGSNHLHVLFCSPDNRIVETEWANKQQALALLCILFLVSCSVSLS